MDVTRKDQKEEIWFATQKTDSVCAESPWAEGNVTAVCLDSTDSRTATDAPATETEPLMKSAMPPTLSASARKTSTDLAVKLARLELSISPLKTHSVA